MKIKKRKFLKLLALTCTACFIGVTPIIVTACGTNSSSSDDSDIDNGGSGGNVEDGDQTNKVDIKLKKDVSFIGSVEMLLENTKETIDSLLSKNPENLIENYDKEKMGDIRVNTNIKLPNDDNWGNIPYEKWNKKDALTKDEPVATLDKIYYPNFEPYFTITSKKDLKEQLNKNLKDILKKIDSETFKDITNASVVENTSPYLDKETNLIHINVETKKTSAKENDNKSYFSLKKESKTETITKYDFCLPASDIDLSVNELRIDVSGNKINELKDQTIKFTYEVGINFGLNNDFKPVDKKIESASAKEYTTQEILKELGWAKEENSNLIIDNQKISEELNIYNVKFEIPKNLFLDEPTPGKKELKLTIIPNDDYFWNDGSKESKTITVANVDITFKTATFTLGTSISDNKLKGTFDLTKEEFEKVNSSNASEYNNQVTEYVEKQFNKDNDDNGPKYKNASISIEKNVIKNFSKNNDETKTKVLNYKFVSIPDNGYLFSDGSKEKKFDVELTINKKVSFNENVNLNGKNKSEAESLDDSSLKTQLDSKISEIIQGHDSTEHSGITLKKVSFMKDEKKDKWGNKPYTEWNKLNEMKEKETFLEKRYDLNNKYKIENLNDLYEQVTKNLSKIFTTSNTNALIVEDTNVGYVTNEDLLHINVKTETIENTKTTSKLYDLCIPMSNVSWQINNVEIETTGGNYADSNGNLVVNYEMGINSNADIENGGTIKFDSSNDVTREKVAEKLGLGTNQERAFVLDQEKVSKYLNVYDANFTLDGLEGTNENKILKIKVTPKEGKIWNDGSSTEKTFSIKNIKIILLDSKVENLDDYTESTQGMITLENTDDITIKNFIKGKKTEIENKIKTDLSSKFINSELKEMKNNDDDIILTDVQSLTFWNSIIKERTTINKIVQIKLVVSSKEGHEFANGEKEKEINLSFQITIKKTDESI